MALLENADVELCVLLLVEVILSVLLLVEVAVSVVLLVEVALLVLLLVEDPDSVVEAVVLLDEVELEEGVGLPAGEGKVGRGTPVKLPVGEGKVDRGTPDGKGDRGAVTEGKVGMGGTPDRVTEGAVV